jgi:hypothetical protein
MGQCLSKVAHQGMFLGAVVAPLLFTTTGIYHTAVKTGICVKNLISNLTTDPTDVNKKAMEKSLSTSWEDLKIESQALAANVGKAVVAAFVLSYIFGKASPNTLGPLSLREWNPIQCAINHLQGV